jgi:hypothetical protein
MTYQHIENTPMKSRAVLFLFPAVFLFVAACNGAGDSVSAPLAVVRTTHAASAPVHQLTGGGKIDLTAFDLFPETYAFSASVDADGNVRGQAQIRLSDPLVSLHAEVTCLAVAGTSAWVGGVVTETSDPNIAPEGMQFWLRAQDNGDGEASNPDKISSVRLGAPASVCSQQRPAAMPWVFFRGDLRVR